MSERTTTLLAITALLGVPGAAAQVQQEAAPNSRQDAWTIEVPETDGPPIMIDGVFTPDEWADAASIRTADGTTFLVKQEKGQLFIGVRRDSSMVGSAVNLFIQAGDGDIYWLHASAQVGELPLAGVNQDDPPFRWGYTPGWTANVARWDQARAKELLDEGVEMSQALARASYLMHGYEFQIQERKFGSSQWRLRFEVVNENGRAPYPPDTERNDSKGWLVLRFGGPGERR
jgi:hypothetical protein